MSEFEHKHMRDVEEIAEVEQRNNKRAEYLEEVKQFEDPVVELNVGNERYQTTIGTLRRIPFTVFDSIFSQHFEDIKKQPDGSIFIDRNGMYFQYILDYLRNIDEEVLLPSDEFTLQLILREARFFKITLLVEHIEQLLPPKKYEDKKIGPVSVYCVSKTL